SIQNATHGITRRGRILKPVLRLADFCYTSGSEAGPAFADFSRKSQFTRPGSARRQAHARFCLLIVRKKFVIWLVRVPVTFCVILSREVYKLQPVEFPGGSHFETGSTKLLLFFFLDNGRQPVAA